MQTVSGAEMLRRLFSKPGITWEELKQIPWDNVPVKGNYAYEVCARHLAGKARDFRQFYTQEERTYAMSVEQWLIRFSDEHTHDDLRQ